jgi:tetratricopeptide (TPR) repeat protein
MLSKPYQEIKRLRSGGQTQRAYALLSSSPPASDEDAFEAVLCLQVCGDNKSAFNVCRTRAWKAAWARDITSALATFLNSGNASEAVPTARQAANASSAPDVHAVYLTLLHADGQIEAADDHMQRHFQQPPLNETFLLSVLTQIAAAVSDWEAAYRHACSVLAADPQNFRALITLSIVNQVMGNHHEALGNALRARFADQASPEAALHVMRCYNGIGDWYAAIGAFNMLTEQAPATADMRVELGAAYAGLDQHALAASALQEALNTNGPHRLLTLRALIALYANAHDVAQVRILAERYRADIENDIESQLSLRLERLQHGDLDGAEARFDATFALARTQQIALNTLPWPVPEPRLRHSHEQLELLAQRGKLDTAGLEALAVLRRHHDRNADVEQRYAPAGIEGEKLQRALTAPHYIPDRRFDGRALGDNDYGAIENQYFNSKPAMVVIDNFLSPDALARLREYCEEASIWDMNYERGYVGALLARGFSPRVLLTIAHELRLAMPRVIGNLPLLQAWAFKYDQRQQGINMHADFAKVNINFWVTPDSACANNTKGGMVIYDVPAPASWTFMDYNTNQSKMMAYLKVHNAQSTRVPYRANRCVLFDSSLIHITDELHFKPGYENRRINVTLLYGRARSVG